MSPGPGSVRVAVGVLRGLLQNNVSVQCSTQSGTAGSMWINNTVGTIEGTLGSREKCFHIERGVLTSGMKLYTPLLCWDKTKGPSYAWCPDFRESTFWGFHCNANQCSI